MPTHIIDPTLHTQVSALGARDIGACMQCGNCSATCPLSKDENTFPRKIYRYLQLGLKEQLLSSPEPWLCYYCGECNIDCPRGAEPAETMMASRRWLTTQYDWTGLATRFYTSPKWEVGAFLAITLFVISLFLVFHGPVVTNRVELNTFAPAHWVHLGDEIMIVIVMALLFSNAFNMYRKIMAGTKVPLRLYITEAPVFIINYFTQKNWRKCGTGPGSAWWRHLFLFSGWVAMEVLVMIFLLSFQTDIIHPFWHPTRLVGYYATVALMLGAGTMLYSRWYKKKEKLHRYSDFTDQFFLVLIFIIATTGIMVHLARLLGLPLTTYTIYVVHVGICVAMLMIMLPFGKLSHLMYRPLAIFLTTIKQKALEKSVMTPAVVQEMIGSTFQTCMQCGTCTASCPKPQFLNFSPRQILRNIALGRASDVNVDIASWLCNTCDSCVAHCPRGIEISDLMLSIREKTDSNLMPSRVRRALVSLENEHTPWPGVRSVTQLQQTETVPIFTGAQQYCLHSCCSTLAAPKGHPNREGAQALTQLLNRGEVSFGSLAQEECCGDLARVTGETELAKKISFAHDGQYFQAGVTNILTSSPHCLINLAGDSRKVQHTSEILANLIKDGSLLPKKELDYHVTYHDPCYLGRKAGCYDAPRFILNSIPGIRFSEMVRIKKESFCCGGGGSGIFQDSRHTKQTENRLQEALATGANTLITTCPYCLEMFNAASITMGVKNSIQIRDLNSVLLESLEI